MTTTTTATTTTTTTMTTPPTRTTAMTMMTTQVQQKNQQRRKKVFLGEKKWKHGRFRSGWKERTELVNSWGRTSPASGLTAQIQSRAHLCWGLTPPNLVIFLLGLVQAKRPQANKFSPLDTSIQKHYKKLAQAWSKLTTTSHSLRLELKNDVLVPTLVNSNSKERTKESKLWATTPPLFHPLRPD